MIVGGEDGYRSSKPRAYLAAALLATVGVVTIIAMVSTGSEIQLIKDLDNMTESAFMEAALENDKRQQVVNIVYLAVFIAAAAAFIVWAHRVSTNLHPLREAGDAYQEYSPVKAVVWWFVPIAWYWMPYRVMKEIWRRSHFQQVQPSSALLTLWWVFWCAGNLLSGISVWDLWGPPPTVEGILMADYRELFANTVLVMAVPLAICVVLATTSAQERKLRELSQEPSPRP